MRAILACMAGLGAALAAPAFAAEAPTKAAAPAPKPLERWAPTSQYEERQIEGWRVLVNKDFPREQPRLCEDTLTLLRCQLYQIPRMVPAQAVAKLRQVTVWVEEKEPHHPCMAYHPSPDWLREHDMNPDKAGCIEVANARTFLAWTRDQPWMVFHELAHAYHHRFLPNGYENAELRAAYERAKQAKLYDQVLHFDGKTVRAYALTNPMEYFAESSEAFFGTNDFYPFVNVELKQYDPEMHKLLTKLWGVGQPPGK